MSEENNKRIVIDTQYMRVEIESVERDVDDPIYGHVTMVGEILHVTVKDGVIGDFGLLNINSKEYWDLVREVPTVIFSLAEPRR